MTTFYIPNSIPKLNNYLSINKQLIKSWLRENCYKSLLDLKIKCDQTTEHLLILLSFECLRKCLFNPVTKVTV